MVVVTCMVLAAYLRNDNGRSLQSGAIRDIEIGTRSPEPSAPVQQQVEADPHRRNQTAAATTRRSRRVLNTPPTCKGLVVLEGIQPTGFGVVMEQVAGAQLMAWHHEGCLSITATDWGYTAPICGPDVESWSCLYEPPPCECKVDAQTNVRRLSSTACHERREHARHLTCGASVPTATPHPGVASACSSR